MKTRTVITYLPAKVNKAYVKKKKIVFWGDFLKFGKFVLCLGLIGIYLIYTNQSSTLGYSLRKSLRELEYTQEQLSVLQLEVSRKEQQLRAQVEWKPSKKQLKKIVE